jgi:hypothetical protein
MEFVELPSFTGRLGDRLTDEDFREVQNQLIANPDRGRLIQGGAGLRKLRAKVGATGKRGGVRIIYYLFSDANQIFLLDIYAKNEKSDLTKDQLKELVEILRPLKRARKKASINKGR